MSLNHIVLVGVVDRPPEKRVSPEGVGTTSFKLKVLRPARAAGGDADEQGEPAAPGRGERFDYVPILALRRTADFAAELRAGETVAVEGRLETFQLPGEQYKNGVRVVAESVNRLGTAAPAGAPTSAAPAYAEPAAATVGAGHADDMQPDFDDSIPF
ncbi:MAG: single-stranded DNA-binding protein [Candidatus Sericytochromatia bacterium]|nr:single-stranded DNA-binding protein [Candidatus Tanganyikabacteria bacterium]